MSTKQYYTYYNDTYGATCYLYIGSGESFCEWLDKKFDCDENPMEYTYAGLSLTLGMKDGSKIHIIWMPKYDFSIEDYVTLSHESLHTAIRIMQNRGCESIGKGSNEELTYFHDSIYRAFLRRLVKDRYEK